MSNPKRRVPRAKKRKSLKRMSSFRSWSAAVPSRPVRFYSRWYERRIISISRSLLILKRLSLVRVFESCLRSWTICGTCSLNLSPPDNGDCWARKRIFLQGFRCFGSEIVNKAMRKNPLAYFSFRIKIKIKIPSSHFVKVAPVASPQRIPDSDHGPMHNFWERIFCQAIKTAQHFSILGTFAKKLFSPNPSTSVHKRFN